MVDYYSTEEMLIYSGCTPLLHTVMPIYRRPIVIRVVLSELETDSRSAPAYSQVGHMLFIESSFDASK